MNLETQYFWDFESNWIDKIHSVILIIMHLVSEIDSFISAVSNNRKILTCFHASAEDVIEVLQKLS